MKKFIIPVLFLFFAWQANAQYSLLSEKINLKDHPSFGQNRLHYMHFFMSYAMMFDADKDVSNDYCVWGSNNFELGLRYKLKFCQYNALGIQASYNYYRFRAMDQLIFREYHAQKLYLNTFSVAIFDRFNFYKRRGDFLGTFLDLGVYYDYNFSIDRSFELKPAANGEIQTIRYSKIDYIEKNNYGFLVQFGINRYVIFGKYRISNLTKDKTLFKEMPRITAGVQIGLF